MLDFSLCLTSKLWGHFKSVTEEKNRKEEQSKLCKAFSHLAHSADAHVQGLGVTACSIQHFGRQLHH